MFYFTFRRERFFCSFWDYLHKYRRRSLRSVLVYTTKVFNQALPTF